jgi:hypothetical protein
MKNLILSLPLALCLVGCVHSAVAPTPPLPPLAGAVNAFDQTSYQTLIAIQATLTSLNNSYKANPAGLASLKAILDQAASDYNISELAWQVYHQSATAVNQAAVTAALTKVQSDLAATAGVK